MTGIEKVVVRPLGVLTVAVSVPDALVFVQTKGPVVCMASASIVTANVPTPLAAVAGLIVAFELGTVTMVGVETIVPFVVSNVTVVPAGITLLFVSRTVKRAVVDGLV